MSLLKDVIKNLAETGAIEHKATIGGHVFEFRALTTEEQLLSDSMVSNEFLKKKYGASGQINTYADTVSKFRSLAILSFAIKSIDGKPPVDSEKTLEEQFKERLEFKEELGSLPPTMFDEIFKEYLEHSQKQKDFFKDAKENLGK